MDKPVENVEKSCGSICGMWIIDIFMLTICYTVGEGQLCIRIRKPLAATASKLTLPAVTYYVFTLALDEFVLLSVREGR